MASEPAATEFRARKEPTQQSANADRVEASNALERSASTAREVRRLRPLFGAGIFLPLVPRSLPLSDLLAVSCVVLHHHCWNVAERDSTNAFLLAAAHPIPSINRPQNCNIPEPRVSERRNALCKRERLVVPLSRDSGAVKVGQPRICVLPKPTDSHGVSLAFQVRQVPAMLDRGENVIRSWLRSFERRDRLERRFKEVWHRPELGQ